MSSHPSKPGTAAAPQGAKPESSRSTLDTDGMLSEWGARLFYPAIKGKGGKGSKGGPGGTGTAKIPLLTATAALTAVMSASEVRSRVRSTVAPGATQVMVKITGGGRGMKAIAAQFRYIGRQGKAEVGGKGKTLEIEDERGDNIQGRDGLVQLTDEWRVAGAYISEYSPRREAFNIIFSMPAGTPPEVVRAATADAARELFEGHKYVFVLHEDQGAPHVHLSVRADRYDGVRLSPRKADLDRWRAVFARNLQDRGVNAVASRQPVRAANQNYRKLWEVRAAGRGQLTRQRPAQRTSARALAARADAIKAWEQIARALASSKDPADVQLAKDAVRYLAEVAPGGQDAARLAARSVQPVKPNPEGDAQVMRYAKPRPDRSPAR
jgi:hypothetical protein